MNYYQQKAADPSGKHAAAPVSDSAQEEQVSCEKLMKQIDAIHELPTLSAVAMQISTMLQDINTSAQDLAKVIEKDQAIVPKLLKLVNSAFFGFSQKVTSVSHALMLLGFNTVRNAVLSIEIINTLELKNKIAGFDITQFWRHAVSVAVVSRYLDQQTGGNFKEDVFTAGLIHDIGKIIMARYFPNHFEKTWYSMQKNATTFQEAEVKHFPVHHAAIGAQLAKRWNLPDQLRRVIAQHHTTKKKVSGESIILLVHAADALVHTYMDDEAGNIDWPICMASRELLAKELTAADQWMPAIKEETLIACQSLLEE